MKASRKVGHWVGGGLNRSLRVNTASRGAETQKPSSHAGVSLYIVTSLIHIHVLISVTDTIITGLDY